jgi:hypothetical protein
MGFLGLACLLAAGARAQRQDSVTPHSSVQAQATGAPPPVEEIIRGFAAKEEEFRQARDNYTYTQTVHVQEFNASGDPGGEFRRTSDVIFTPEGKRFERITYAPPPTLKMLSLSREDIEDLANIQPFVLTTADLPKYILEFGSREQVDEISTYVFHVRPRRMERDERYFEGTIWVDDRDLQIVKTYGKAVPDIRHRGQENLFPRFETYRENIDGKYWFPTYTHADDVLHFRGGDVRVRMTVRYVNYKQFKTSARIVGAEPVKPDENKPPSQPPGRPPNDAFRMDMLDGSVGRFPAPFAASGASMGARL